MTREEERTVHVAYVGLLALAFFLIMDALRDRDSVAAAAALLQGAASSMSPNPVYVRFQRWRPRTREAVTFRKRSRDRYVRALARERLERW